MNIPKRRVLVLGVASAGILALAVALVADGGEERLAVRGRAENAPSTTSSTTAPPPDASASTGTTVALVPFTTGVPVPNATEAPPATAVPSATPAAPGSVATGSSLAGGASPSTSAGTAVSADGAVMTRSASGATRAIDKAKGCNSAAGEGWTIEECGALRTTGTVLVWLVETKGKASRALVLKEQTSTRWAVVLSAADVDGTAFAKIGVRAEDVSGDGQAELVFGFHRKDAAANLAMDVVDATPATVVHRELARGSVVLAKGEIATWASAGGDAYDRVVIKPVAGAWRASAPERVARIAVPASMI